MALCLADKAWQQSYLLSEAQYDGKLYLPLGTAEVQLIESQLKINSATMAGIRDARGRSGTAWHLMAASLDSDAFVLARAAALLAHSRGDDAAAVEYLRDILFAATAVGEQPAVASSNAARNLRRLAYDGVCQIAPRLNAGTSPATAAQLASLMTDLQDEATQTRQLVRAMHGDRLWVLGTDRQLAEQMIPLDMGWPASNTNFVQRTTGFVVLPRVRLTALGDARFLTVVAGHIGRGDLRAAYNASTAHPRPRDVSLFYPVAQAEHLSNLFAVNSAMDMQLRVLTDRRAAVTVLAIRLYSLDHGSRRPAKLDELVPRYLPAVPIDPFAIPPQPLRYLPGNNPPLVYSLGQDSVDNLGQKGWRPKTWSTHDNWWPPTGRDSIYPLAPPAPATRPSAPQAAPDQQ